MTRIVALLGLLAWASIMPANAPANMLLRGAGSGVTATTWNPARISGGVGLSGGNLIATTSGSGGSAIATNPTASGKKYFELTVTGTGVDGDNAGFGFTNTTGGAGGDAALYQDGHVYVGGASICDFVTISMTSGDTVDVADDITNHLAWWRTTSMTNWNNNVSANPATGVGGCDYSGQATLIATGHSPSTFMGGTSDSATARFSSASWVHTAPAGFGQY